MEVTLANPRGFCAGVERAIAIVRTALARHGAPIYVRHEVVHNRYVVNELRQLGAVFVNELDEVPDDAWVVFSAHGVAKAVEVEAERRGLHVFDATCPLVTKVHNEVARHACEGIEVILIGHAGHPEVEGTLGRYGALGIGAIHLVQTVAEVAALQVGNPGKLAYVTQTTLSVDDTARIVQALQAKFPSIQGPKKDDICYATQNRQDAVKALADTVDLLLVVGSNSSSNSNRLRELAQHRGIEAHLIDGPHDLQPQWLKASKRIGVTAGASAPEVLVQAVIDELKRLGARSVQESDGTRETVVFSLPRALR